VVTVPGSVSGTTPTSYTVSLNAQALALAAGSYKTNLVFTCVTPVACTAIQRRLWR